MKRVILSVLIVVGLVAIYAFIPQSSAEASHGKETPVKLSLDRTCYSPTDTLVLTITNNGNETITVGYPFELYREENGKWVEVKVDLMFIQSVVQLEPGKSWTQKVNLSKLKLSPGHYRIAKRASTQDGTFTLSAEFCVAS